MTVDQVARRNAAAKKFYRRNRERLLQERRDKAASRTPEERERLKQRRKELERSNSERVKARQRATRQRNKVKIAAQKLASAQRNRVHIREYQRKWAAKNRNIQESKRKTYRWRIRLATIAAYGGACACCGEREPKFLTIDHIYNDGATERKGDRALTGTKFYLWLKQRGWPADRYQLLCFNCNCAKGQFGVCPHQQRKALQAVAS